jgi:hypothetical protein
MVTVKSFVSRAESVFARPLARFIAKVSTPPTLGAKK